jgi:hypothetical protein
MNRHIIAHAAVSAALAAASLALASCQAPLPSSPAERAYRDAAMAHPTTFTLPPDRAADAWARANAWVGRFSGAGIETATEFVIRTPIASGDDYSYIVTRAPVAGGAFEFSVACDGGANTNFPSIEQNRHLLAYFIATGEPTPDALVAH